MASANGGKRPLSPHLGIYRPQMSSVSSIVNRITGIGLTLGFVLIIWWLLAATVGGEYFDCINNFLTGWFGGLIMIGSVWALSYHMLAGIRHLVWDMGYGFELKTADRMGWAVIIGSFLMTLAVLCRAGVFG
jgi:succinate dehydrogenase / fumarate reductase cytochrome b subunit